MVTLSATAPSRILSDERVIGEDRKPELNAKIFIVVCRQIRRQVGKEIVYRCRLLRVYVTFRDRRRASSFAGFRFGVGEGVGEDVAIDDRLSEGDTV